MFSHKKRTTQPQVAMPFLPADLSTERPRQPPLSWILFYAPYAFAVLAEALFFLFFP